MYENLKYSFLFSLLSRSIQKWEKQRYPEIGTHLHDADIDRRHINQSIEYKRCMCVYLPIVPKICTYMCKVVLAYLFIIYKNFLKFKCQRIEN